MDIRKELLNNQDIKYKEFISKLIPGCDNIIGVRMPIIKKLAKECLKTEYENIFNEEEIYFEEVMLKGIMIANMKKDIDDILKYVDNHVPKITNWSLCDSFVSELKIVKKHDDVVFKYIKKYYTSNEAYEIRFAVVLLLFHFINEKYIDDIFKIMDSIKHDEYYVKMAVAWALSMCYVKFPDATMNYFKNNNLDNFTYNKALQKAIESTRVSLEDKNILRSMKKSDK